jgi:hypothetical protein
MNKIIAILALISLTAFMNPNNIISSKNDTVITLEKSFSLLNDTKNKVSIYTGSGFVSLNKGSKTSISCKIGKEVRWAEKGKKGDVIFKIADKHCGKTVKLTDVMD